MPILRKCANCEKEGRYARSKESKLCAKCYNAGFRTKTLKVKATHKQ